MFPLSGSQTLVENQYLWQCTFCKKVQSSWVLKYKSLSLQQLTVTLNSMKITSPQGTESQRHSDPKSMSMRSQKRSSHPLSSFTPHPSSTPVVVCPSFRLSVTNTRKRRQFPSQVPTPRYLQYTPFLTVTLTSLVRPVLFGVAVSSDLRSKIISSAAF